MPRTYRRLDLDERRTLFRLVEARRPVGEIAERLNDKPRRCLGHRTPREVFEAHLAAPTGSP